MSLKIERRKLWESIPLTNVSITIMKEFQKVCDKIILDAGVLALRELCEKLLAHLHMPGNEVTTSQADDDDVISSLADDGDLTVEHTKLIHLDVTQLRDYAGFEDHRAVSLKHYINILPSKLCDDLPNDDVISNKRSCRRVKETEVSDRDVRSAKPARKRKQSYCCLQCNKSFVGTLSLNKHVQKKHPMKQEENCDTSIISKNNDSTVPHNNDVNLVKMSEVLVSPNESVTVSQCSNMTCVQDSNMIKCQPDVNCVAEYPDLSRPELSADGVTASQSVVSDSSSVQLPILKPTTNETSSSTKQQVSPVSQNSNGIVLQCSVSPKTFENQSARHVTSNTFCLECGKTYATPAHLRRHQRVHTGERPYSCIICAKTFNDATTLKRHFFRHSDEPKSRRKRRANKVTVSQSVKSDSSLDQLPIVKSGNKRTSAIKQEQEISPVSLKSEEIAVCPKTCLECGKTYATPAHLRRHQRVHTGERPFVCSFCGKAFNDATTLRRHIVVHTVERKNVCSECGKIYQTTKSLDAHMRRTHKLGDCLYLCMKCGKKYAFVNNLKIHELSCKVERPYVCQYCSKRFINADTVQKHVIKVHNDARQLQCPVCSKTFTSAHRLARHINNHVTKKSALNNQATKKITSNKQAMGTKKTTLCLECGKTYATPAHLRRHLRVHTGERPFVCNKCGQTFNDATTLKRHNLKHTGERPHVCSQCGQRYRSNFTLVAHVRRTHNLEDCPYMCVRCGKKCAVAKDLEVHEVGCKGERPHACPLCNKRFTTTGNVTKHLRVHTGEKPYVCSICDKRFAQASCVKEHIKVIHNGERPFQCSKCNQRWPTRTDLKRHELVHSRRRPFPCTQCHKTFSRLSFLKMHESKH